MTKVESKKRREKGLGSIIDRGGKYEGTFVLHRENGSRLEKSFTRRTRNEIIDIQSQLRNLGLLEDNVKDVHIDRNTNKITLIRSGQNKSNIGLDKDILVKDYLMHYLFTYRKKGINGRVIEDTTFSSYMDRAKVIEKYIGNVKIRELTFEDIEELINKLSKYTASSTVVQIRQLIANMLYYAKKDGVINENVLANEKINIKEKKAKKEKKIIEPKDIQKFVNYCKEHKYYILIFILSSGCRASEIAGLTWDAVDIDKMTIKIEKEYARVKRYDEKDGKKIIKRTKEFKELKSKDSYRTIRNRRKVS